MLEKKKIIEYTIQIGSSMIWEDNGTQVKNRALRIKVKATNYKEAQTKLERLLERSIESLMR